MHCRLLLGGLPRPGTSRLNEDLQAIGWFRFPGRRVDLGTPAGRLQLHILAALSEFERGGEHSPNGSSGRRLGFRERPSSDGGGLQPRQVPDCATLRVRATDRGTMNNLKTVLRIGGIVVALLGLMFLPSRNFVFDKGDLSAFHNWADVGVFVRPGWVDCCGVGRVRVVVAHSRSDD